MNEQDEKAYETWANGFRYRMDIHARQAWQACCEYKDKQYNPYGELKAAANDPTKQIRLRNDSWPGIGYKKPCNAKQRLKP